MGKMLAGKLILAVSGLAATCAGCALVHAITGWNTEYLAGWWTCLVYLSLTGQWRSGRRPPANS